MMYEQLYRDVMRRTKRNLEIIEELHQRGLPGAEGPYELTHLLNSFLGAVALPRERDLARL
jgi:hypothetical protein